jgi:hypothetical protein
MELSGKYFENSGSREISDREIIATIAESKWLSRGPWEVHDGPLPAEPHYVIELYGAEGRLATYKSAPIGCFWISCPGWIGFESADGTPLVRHLGEGAYLTFASLLLKAYGPKRLHDAQQAVAADGRPALVAVRDRMAGDRRSGD